MPARCRVTASVTVLTREPSLQRQRPESLSVLLGEHPAPDDEPGRCHGRQRASPASSRVCLPRTLTATSDRSRAVDRSIRCHGRTEPTDSEPPGRPQAEELSLACAPGKGGYGRGFALPGSGHGLPGAATGSPERPRAPRSGHALPGQAHVSVEGQIAACRGTSRGVPAFRSSPEMEWAMRSTAATPERRFVLPSRRADQSSQACGMASAASVASRMKPAACLRRASSSASRAACRALSASPAAR